MRNKLILAFVLFCSATVSFFIGRSLDERAMSIEIKILEEELISSSEINDIIEQENNSLKDKTIKLQYIIEDLNNYISVMNEKGKMKKVKINTNYGDIVIALDGDKAPISTENFINYVENNFYNETIFHRIIPGFMIQGGGHLEDMSPKDQKLEPILNEANNGLKNDRGTIAMARTADPHSATSQFFINHVDNSFLNFRTDQVDEGWGYAVFGKVIEGIEVVDKIAAVQTTAVMGYQDVPTETIKIISAEVLD